MAAASIVWVSAIVAARTVTLSRPDELVPPRIWPLPKVLVPNRNGVPTACTP